MTLSLSAGVMPTPEFRPAAILKPESFKLYKQALAPSAPGFFPGLSCGVHPDQYRLILHEDFIGSSGGPDDEKGKEASKASFPFLSFFFALIIRLPLQSLDEDISDGGGSDNAADPDPGRHPAERMLAFVGCLCLCSIKPDPAHEQGDENPAERQQEVR